MLELGENEKAVDTANSVSSGEGDLESLLAVTPRESSVSEMDLRLGLFIPYVPKQRPISYVGEGGWKNDFDG